MKRFTLLATIILIALASCNNNKFHLDGNVEGASDTTDLVLELSRNGQWQLVDTIAPASNGSFSVYCQAPEDPSIYRLRYNDRFICFPIDSLDHITLKTKLSAFDSDYTLEGSENAKKMMEIDRQAQTMVGKTGTEQYKKWKRQLAETIVADPAGIVAYYIINKSVDGKPVFDPADDYDLKIVGAVANAFYSFRPNDKRTNYLVSVLTQGMQRRRLNSEPTDTIFATEASLIDINLQDYNGKKHDLEQVAKEYRVVVLNFTIYEAEFSPVLNKMLNDVYAANHADKRLEIYQISLDPDNVVWKQSAQNLPWITVYEPMGENAVCVGAYQLKGVPTTFIIRGGDIVERIEDHTQLKTAIQKWL